MNPIKTWTPLSGPYEAAGGISVRPVDSNAKLEDLATGLSNGLLLVEPRELWSDLCKQGKRQIAGIYSGDNLVANAEFKVVGGEMRAMFVRGEHNVEFNAGHPFHDATTAYVSAVNSASIPLAMVMRENSFVRVEPEKVVEGPWERARRLGQKYLISTFMALVGNLPADAEPASEMVQTQEPFEDISWTALSAPHAARNGLVIEPVSSRSALRTLGVELENNLFHPMMTSYLADVCKNGGVQIAAVYREADGLVGYAEMRAVNGQLVASTLRGYGEEAPEPDIARAMIEYVALVNAQLVETNLSMSTSGFVVGPVNETNLFSQELMPSVGLAIPLAQRSPYAKIIRSSFGHDEDYALPAPGM